MTSLRTTPTAPQRREIAPDVGLQVREPTELHVREMGI
jgi:hypothetical protein